MKGSHAMTIPASGIHKISDREYFAIDLPSSSSTKVLIGGTNAHLAFQREEVREENDAFIVGAYVHALLLDPTSVEENFIRIGDIDRRTTVGKAEWALVQTRAARNGARILTRDLREQGDAMAAAVRANPAAATLINTMSDTEVSIVGEIGGRPAKAKVDGIIRMAGACIVIDVKTTESAAPRDFAGSAAKFGYFHQAAFYRRLVEQYVSVVDDYIILAVEKKPPYLTAVYRVPSLAIESADHGIDKLVNRWWAVHDGDRTGYGDTIQDLEPPRWWLTQE